MSLFFQNQSHYWLTRIHLPITLLDPLPSPEVLAAARSPWYPNDLILADVEIQAGRIQQIQPTGQIAAGEVPQLDRAGGLAWPCFVDLHTHLDKGQMWFRTAGNGTFEMALQQCAEDRSQFWTHSDLYRRMEFGLKCSYAHGTQAVRTHLDAMGPEAKTSFDVFQTLRDEWRDRITLQGVCLVPLDYFMTPEGEQLADWCVEAGVILGGVAYKNPDSKAQIHRVFDLAEARQITQLDFHVDESLDPAATNLHDIAEIARDRQYPGSIVCGHCCSLSVQSPEVAQAAIAAVAAAKIGVVSLPLCNLYLQDRQGDAPDRTPRYRGVTLLNELQQAGVPVAVASDNCRDPFHAYGDYDGVEVYKLSTRIAHLDHPWGDWPRVNTRTAADLMGLDLGRIGVGRSADLILFKARSLNELMARSQHDRLVLRQGQLIDTTPPDYAELDDVLAIPKL